MALRITCLLSLCVLFLAGCGPQGPPEPTLSLTVTSDPTAAQVLIDGTPAGTTPVTRTMRPGEHMIEIAKAGYETLWTKTPGAAVGELKIPVTLNPARASVFLDSTPTGALLTLNGEGKGKTPLLLQQLAFGTYDAELATPGYATKRFRVTVADARPCKRVETLESVTCTLQVWTTPGGADVSIDGKFYGLTPENAADPLTIRELIAGEYTLSVSKTGFKGITQPLLLNRQEQKEVRIPPLIGLPGGLEVVTAPPGADIYNAGGQLLGQSPYKATNLPAGKMTLRIQKRGFADETRDLVIAAGFTQKIDVTLSRFFGSVNFTTEPPDCRVLVDGKGVGITAVSNNAKVSAIFEYDGLTPGRHVLELQHPEYETSTVRVTIEQGRATSLGALKLKARWLPTHRLTLANGNTYEGVLVRKNDDGSIVFESAPTIRIGYAVAEVRALVPLKPNPKNTE